MQPHHFWQEIHPAGQFDTAGPYRGSFPAALADGRQLLLPIRPLSDGEHGLASLIVNQASFAVLDALAADLAARLRPHAPDVIVGLPTLGLTLAAAVAQKLGHGRYVPLGTSRKFWYQDDLSVPLSSITTPDQVKRLYIDPRMLPLLEGRRFALVDDVISSGTSIVAGLSLLKACDLVPVAVGAAMLQTDRWRDSVKPSLPHDTVVHGCFQTPLLRRQPDDSFVAA